MDLDRGWPALAALLGAILLQIATNFANDLFDFKAGADTEDRLGPPRATQQGWISPRAMAWGTGLTLLAALAVGVYLVWVGGWPIALLGAVSLFLTLAYTGGPFPLAYHGLGDLFVFLFFGLAATLGTWYVQVLQLGEALPALLLAATPVGCLATAILVVNNLRDIEGDARAGKRTLAVRFGPRAARIEYTGLLCLAFLSPVVSWVSGVGGIGWCLPWLILPLAWVQNRGIWQKDGRDLNPYLGGTARLEALFGLLLCVGFFL
jgi:1,4-dihydroxy-2-naphthoate octaprenyltransferase